MKHCHYFLVSALGKYVRIIMYDFCCKWLCIWNFNWNGGITNHKIMSDCLSGPVAPLWVYAAKKGSPDISVMGQFLQLSPSKASHLHTCLQVSAPGVSWSASPPFALWIPKRACLEVHLAGLRRVWPIQSPYLHLLWRISSLTGCCLVHCHSYCLLIISGQRFCPLIVWFFNKLESPIQDLLPAQTTCLLLWVHRPGWCMSLRCVESELELIVNAILNITLNCPTPPPFITLAEMKNSPPEDDDNISSVSAPRDKRFWCHPPCHGYILYRAKFLLPAWRILSECRATWRHHPCVPALDEALSALLWPQSDGQRTESLCLPCSLTERHWDILTKYSSWVYSWPRQRR